MFASILGRWTVWPLGPGPPDGFIYFFTQKTILFIYFETKSHVSQAGFRLTVQLRMTLSF